MADAMVRRLLLVCIIVAQFVRIAAYAASAGDIFCSDGTAATATHAPVSKIVQNSLIYQLELLTKLASLACAISENKTPVPSKTPVPVSRTSSEIIVPANAPTLSKQTTVQPQTVVSSAQPMVSQIFSTGANVHAPPGLERTPSRLFALARGGLDGSSASFFSYGINQNPQSRTDWGFFFVRAACAHARR
jgi:hypothetical protein